MIQTLFPSFSSIPTYPSLISCCFNEQCATTARIGDEGLSVAARQDDIGRSVRRGTVGHPHNFLRAFFCAAVVWQPHVDGERKT